MAFEQFPTVKKGDRLTADLINRLCNAARRVEMAGLVGGANQFLGPPMSGTSQLPPFLQVPVEITNDSINSSDLNDSGLYLCKMLYFEPSDSDGYVGEWKTQDQEWQLDATAAGMNLAVGDHVNAYWHQQRGMFLVVGGEGGMYIAKPQTSDGIPALTNDNEPGKADCDIYRIDPDTEELVAVEDDDGNPVEKEVYNISEAPIGQDWILVEKTKHGKWVAIPGATVFGKLDEALEQGDSAVMSVYAKLPLSDTGQNVDVYDRLLEVGAELPINVWCVATRYCGRWYVTSAECPV